MPARPELIASGKNLDQLAADIRTDGIIFQDLADLKSSITEVCPSLTHFDTSVFDGAPTSPETLRPPISQPSKSNTTT
jgi:amidophosphoribosyltransferase